MLPVVDECDRDLLEKYQWKLSGAGYPCAKVQLYYFSVLVFLHRIIAQRMGLDLKLAVDHKDRDRTNNRRSNLRNATGSQNAWNAGMYSSNTSGLKGVTWSKRAKKWVAQIGGKNPRYLGLFYDKYQAALAYDQAVIAYRGEFAVTNQSLGLIPGQYLPKEQRCA